MADRELRLKATLQDDISRGLPRIGAAAAAVGDSFEDTAGDARKLEREIKDAEQALRGLAREFARTDDAAKRMDLSKSMRKAQADIRTKTKARDLLPDAGDAAKAGLQFGAEIGVSTARGLFANLSASVQTSLKSVAASPVGAVVGATIGTAIAATAGAALSGGLLAAISGGAVAGGVALALRDPQVAQAASSAGKMIGDRLGSAAEPFKAKTIGAFQDITASFGRVEGSVVRIFSSASEYVRPLVAGITGLVERMMPAVDRAVSRAAPVISALQASLPRLGDAIGDAFDAISENGPEAATAIRQIVLGIGDMIRFGGEAVAFLTDMYGRLINVSVAGFQMLRAWEWLPVVGGYLADNRKRFEELKGSMDGARVAGQAQASVAALQATASTLAGAATQRQGSAAADAAITNQALAVAMQAVANRALAASNSQIALEQSIDDATAAVKTNGRHLDINSEKGRANRQALNGIAAAANDAAQKILEQTGSQQQASAASERGRAAFIRTATSMGMSATAARNLAAKLFAIPNINRDVRIHNEQAIARIQEIKNSLAGLTGKTIHIRTKADIPQGLSMRQLMEMGRETGGPVKKGEAYVVGEKRAEVFVPDRDGQIIPSVEQFQGMAGGGRAAGGGGGLVFNIGTLVVRDAQSPEQLVRQLQAYADRNGGIRLKTRTS